MFFGQFLPSAADTRLLLPAAEIHLLPAISWQAGAPLERGGRAKNEYRGFFAVYGENNNGEGAAFRSACAGIDMDRILMDSLPGSV